MAEMSAREAEEALERVREMAESWVSLGDRGDTGGDVDAHAGRFLLGEITGAGSRSTKISRLTTIAEAWLTPGTPGLYYPAAGQCVLDAIRGDRERTWQERAERAEAQNAALREALKRHMTPLGDSRGTQLCAGCLEPKPCPDEGLAEGP